MTYEEAEKILQMIDGNWRIRMDEATADLWMVALVAKDAELATRVVARLAKAMEHAPRIAHFEEVYAMMQDLAQLPPAGQGCPTCHGDRFVLVSRVAPWNSQWVAEHGFPTPEVPLVEQMAPCPECNPSANTSFRRHDGSMFEGPDPARVRDLLSR